MLADAAALVNSMLEPPKKGTDRYMVRGFIHLTDYSEEELISLMDAADRLRQLWSTGSMPQTLRNKNVALVWDAGGFETELPLSWASLQWEARQSKSLASWTLKSP